MEQVRELNQEAAAVNLSKMQEAVRLLEVGINMTCSIKLRLVQRLKEVELDHQ